MHAKVRRAVQLFDDGKDSRQVAEELGYKGASSLSAMMRGAGLRWDSKVRNYVSENGNAVGNGNGDTDIMALLKEKAPQLEAVLDWFDKTNGAAGEPRVMRMSGPTVTKSFRLPVEVDDRLNEFCREKVLHQKDVLVTAIVEYLDRYE